MDFAEIEKYINEIPKFASKNDLNHTRSFLEELNIDEDEFKIIHVAGTNGKGSVCAMMSNVLVKCKINVGLFVSPHLVTINERIRINNEIISKEEFVNAFDVVNECVKNMEKKGYDHPSFFEFLFIMAMLVFKKRNVEYIILETGMGGRLDATNVIKNPLVTIITSIGMDHMEYLGDTIEKIAEEKAGIIKENVPVVFWAQDDKVKEVIEGKALEKQCEMLSLNCNNYKIRKKNVKSIAFLPCLEYYLFDTFEVPFMSEYQVQNAMLVIGAWKFLLDLRDRQSELYEGIKSVMWEGRMEFVRENVIFDGAHNGPGIDEFIKTFREYKCDGKKYVLFSVVNDKDDKYMLSKIAEEKTDEVIVARLNSKRALEAAKISEDLREAGYDGKIDVFDNTKEAFEYGLKITGDKDVLFCVGSLYLIGELKGYLI